VVPDLWFEVHVPRLYAGRRTPGAGAIVTDLPVCVGDVVRIRFGDYHVGLGPLLMRVTEIVPPHPQFPDATWTFVRGIELRCDGAVVGERHVLVRVGVLRRQEKR
jgi:hypothetical protein